MNTRIVFIGAILLTVVAGLSPQVFAETTVPQRVIYNGHLLDSSGTAIASEVNIRFSYWTSTDYVTGDVTATGAINIGASNYANWYEEHTVTPDSKGYFSVEIGSVTALPDFSELPVSTLLNLHMQVELKASSAADTAYELLDRDSTDDTVDRSPVRSVPFSLNTNFLDRKQIGSGSGNITFLGSGGYLREGGTLANRFTIDADSSSGGTLYLRFGADLGKELSYDQGNSYFNFNDDVNIQGDLTVTGLINGVDISSLSAGSDQTHLKVSSGAGLSVNISAGDYRLNGNVTQYSGNSNQAVTDDTTNYVFIGSGGLTIRTSGFPTDEAFIRLATVVTSGGAIQTISDRRVFNSDDRERTIVRTYAPEYDGSSIQADGSNNVGQLSVTNSGAAVTNHYVWTSTRSSLQDYDIVVQSEVPTAFVRWDSTPLSIRYRTTSAADTSAKLDIEVYDTAGNQVTLGGSYSALNSTEWTTADITFSGTPTWNTGSGFLIKVRPFAKDSEKVQIGHLKLRYVELPRE
ncbi:MAG: hypothetical protein KC680_02485 [Candidatus Peregrinibacteria bacterium]|nr:hypothetical protein [Candidatus Peregrinibacteria bacterium]MCB9808537.1 hypothetical protein [Candidatus Peribacteria bacterium]